MRWAFGLMLVAACSSGGGGGGAPDSGPDAGSDSGSDAGPKHPIAGLVDMQDIAWHNDAGGEPTFTIANVDQFPGLFGGIVVNATWDSMQAAPDAGLDFTHIEDALAQVRTYNAAHPSAPLGVKLRVFAGASAPAWAKALNGGPITIERNPNGCPHPPCPYIDYTFNPFTPLKGPSDGGFPETVMSDCRAQLGSRCIIDNHVLEAPLNAASQPIYDQMVALGPPINFQTGSPQQMTCLWTQTIAQGVQLGAASIEVWPEAKFQGFDSFDGGNVAQLADEFVHPIDAGTPTPLPTPCSGFH